LNFHHVPLISLRPDEASVLFTLAVAWEQLGDRDEALAWLEKAIAAGYTRERIERSPSLSELRKDRRFSGLMTR
jgi:tetratricopeptide (TPR) repeat protein